MSFEGRNTYWKILKKISDIEKNEGQEIAFNTARSIFSKNEQDVQSMRKIESELSNKLETTKAQIKEKQLETKVVYDNLMTKTSENAKLRQSEHDEKTVLMQLERELGSIIIKKVEERRAWFELINSMVATNVGVLNKELQEVVAQIALRMKELTAIEKETEHFVREQIEELHTIKRKLAFLTAETKEIRRLLDSKKDEFEKLKSKNIQRPSHLLSYMDF